MRTAAHYRLKAGRRDSNHAAIRDGLRHLGHFVIDLASCGDGVPDLCVFPRGGTSCVWLELKAGKGKLRASQVAWRFRAEARGLKVRTVRTLDEALEACA